MKSMNDDRECSLLLQLLKTQSQMPATTTPERSEKVQEETLEWMPMPRLKIPAPRTGSWLESYGSWEGFCQAIRKSTGRNLAEGVLTFSKDW